MKKLLQNMYFRYVLVLLIGITVGVVLYPTKSVEETIKKRYEKELIAKTQEFNTQLKTQAELIDNMFQKHTEYRENSFKKYAEYESRISILLAKTKESTFKLVKPDGTVVEKTFKSSETSETTEYIKQVKEEFNRKVQSIENKWMRIHTERIETLNKTQEKKLEEYRRQVDEEYANKVTKTNEKKFYTEFGYTKEKKYYLHNSYALWGPIFVGSHLDGKEDGTDIGGGVGVGIRW